MTIPLFDARREYEAHADELRAAAERVLASGRYILGPEVDAFEREAAAYLGAKHAIGCASGTDALWLALKAAGIGPGDGVITSGFTFFATASAILNVGAVPVLCDIDPPTFNIKPDDVQVVVEGRSPVHERIGIDPARIRAIVPVHLYGQTADMEPLLEIARAHDLRVIEDAAQALGAVHNGRKAGTMGDLGCFSFFPTKNLGGFGDGGLVVTEDDDLAARVLMLRNHGGISKYENRIVGTNSRLDELQAALLRVRLRHLDEALAGRRRVADAYDDLFRGSAAVTPDRAPNRQHAFNLYVLRLPDRDDVRRALEQAGIATAVHYPAPVHLQPALGQPYRPGDLVEAERACKEVLTIPLSPHLRADEARSVAEASIAALKRTRVTSLPDGA